MADRVHALESCQVRHDELEFRIAARRDRLVGLWAAERLGFTGGRAESYAREVVAAGCDEPGDHDVVRKLLHDFRMRHLRLSEAEIHRQLSRCRDIAERQMRTGG